MALVRCKFAPHLWGPTRRCSGSSAWCRKRKAPIQALVDRVAMYFVPSMMAAALLTAVVWLMFGPDTVVLARWSRALLS